MHRKFFIPVFLMVLLWAVCADASGTDWEDLHRKAESLRAQGKYSECLKTYDRLLGLTKTTYGENNTKVADVLIEMSLVHRYDLGDEKQYARLRQKAKSVQLTLNGSVRCRAPKDWSYEKCTERWLGRDPCFVYRNVDHYIKVTYYGLDDSRFQKPDDFIRNLKGLFRRFKAEEKIKMDGRSATRILLRYEQGDYHDHDGVYRLPAFIYEEFLLAPLERGFLVFNLNLNGPAPLPPKFNKEDAPKNLYGDAEDAYRAWTSFTGSCKINP